MSRHENENTRKFSLQSVRRAALAATVGLAVAVSGAAMAEPAAGKPSPEQMEKMQALKQLMQQQIQMMTPEMQQRVKALSPQNKQALLRIYAQHTRRSDTITLRQVMHEVLSDYQSIVAGIVTDNGEQAADAARRLANHRLPRGGLLPYMKLEQVTDEMVGTLVPFNDSVEGNALRLAEAADKGDMNKAAEYLSQIASGCVGCHQVFRGVPGQTPYLKK